MPNVHKYTTEWIGRTAIFCNDKIPHIYYRMDWQDYHIFLWQNVSNIILNGLVELPYFVMAKFLKYTTGQIGRATIIYNDKIPQLYY